jgi:predicted transcriptional regulator
MFVLDKKKIMNSLRDLPEKTTVEEAMERLYLLAKIEKGIKQADEGECISHEEAKEKMKKWLK